MTAVSASPTAVSALAHVLRDGGASLVATSDALVRALSRFATRAPAFAPPADPVPAVLEHQGRRIDELGARLDRFVVALLAADEAGATSPLGRLLPVGRHDVVLVDAAVLATFQPLDPGAPLRDLLRVARAELARHDEAEPPLGPLHRVTWLHWLGERHQLNARVRQYQALVEPPHPGWGGVHLETWPSAASYLHAVHRTRDQARALLDTDAQSRPFLAAAVEHHALLTPERLHLLVDLDDLATMALDEFLEARASAELDRPLFDWTADGCSGPIPGRAEDACLRHDFLYRNGRMLRDQWGLDVNYASDLKEFADATFGDELDDPYPWWELQANGALRSWLDLAEVAVEVFGDVGEPWNPPRQGAFYGSMTPGS